MKFVKVLQKGGKSLTHNQIDYWSYKEDQRHNKATEDFQNRSLAESVRHNKQTEELGFKTLMETSRHNRAQEALSWGQIQLGYANLSETQRHNRATEANQLLSVTEQQRHNLATEKQASANWILDLGSLGVRRDELTVKQGQLEVSKSDNSRKWVDTILKNVGDGIEYVTRYPLEAIDALIPG